MNNIITVGSGNGGIVLSGGATTVYQAVRIEGNIIRPCHLGDVCEPINFSPTPPATFQLSCDNNIFESGGGQTYTDIHCQGYDYEDVTMLSFKNNHNLRGVPLTMGDYPVWSYVLNGEYDDDLSFTPTQPGWYKIFSVPAWNTPCSARVNIWSKMGGGKPEYRLWFGFHAKRVWRWNSERDVQ